VPKALYKHFQKLDTKLEAQSETIDLGTPCNITTSLTYKGTKPEAEFVVFMGIKWETFVNLSITTQIASLLLGEQGKPTTKSMVMFSHFHIGISSGFNNPAGL